MAVQKSDKNSTSMQNGKFSLTWSSSEPRARVVFVYISRYLFIIGLLLNDAIPQLYRARYNSV